MLKQSISEPVLYGDLVYKFKRTVGKPTFSDQFKKINRVIKKLDTTWISCDSLHVWLVVCFDLILYVQSTIFQLNRDGSSWVEPVLS